MVDKRCAIIKLVRPSINFRKASWISISVRVSIDDVASSSINTFGTETKIRAIDKSCCSPLDKFNPPSVKTVSYPSGNAVMNLCACAAFAALITVSRSASGCP